MLDYDKEAARYDATRGGDARADAAAGAIESLLSRVSGTAGAGGTGPRDGRGGVRTVLDCACGTGIVTVRLAGAGRLGGAGRLAGAGRVVLGVDKSTGMAAVAARRLPGRITVGDVTRLPFPARAVDAVTMVWLLHLLDDDASARALAEAARVLRPGGALITTVNKNDAMYHRADEAACLAGRVRGGVEAPQPDDCGRVAAIAAEHGLAPAAETTFAGLGQGLSPAEWTQYLGSGHVPWTSTAGPERMAALRAQLTALPDQRRRRPDPVYRLVALRKG